MKERYEDYGSVHGGVLPPLIVMRFILDGGAAKFKVHQRAKILHLGTCGPPRRILCHEAQNKAMKIERLQIRVLLFKRAAGWKPGNTRAQQGSTSSEWPLAREAIDALRANSATTAAPTTKGNENPYVKPRIGKCYRCGLASVIGVANLDTGPMSVRKRGMLTWRTTRMKMKY